MFCPANPHDLTTPATPNNTMITLLVAQRISDGVTGHRSLTADAPASHSGGPGFKSQSV